MSLFEHTIENIKKAAKIFNIKESLVDLLSKPEHIHEATLEVEDEYGDVHKFQAWRVQHNSLLGKYKGGIRYDEGVDLDLIKGLSTEMTLKNAVSGLNLGGAKGGVKINPKIYLPEFLRKVDHAYAEAFYDVIGPKQDGPAPDVGTNSINMCNMQAKLIMLSPKTDKWGKWGTFSSKKPRIWGGSKVRNEATGLGGFFKLQVDMRDRNQNMYGMTMSAIGAGNAVQGFLEEAINSGMILQAISDSSGAIYNPDGLDINAIINHKKSKGSLIDLPNCEIITKDKLLSLKVDVLIAGAKENQINESNMEMVRPKYIVELANGPVSPVASENMFVNNVVVFPDLATNNGGVIVSSFETAQNSNEYYLSEDVIRKDLFVIQEEIHLDMLKIQKAQNCDLRMAAMGSALMRLQEVAGFYGYV